jgi:membrane-bound lytic murein transglycosylase
MFPMSKVFKSIVGLLIVSSSLAFAATPAKAESKTAQCQRFNQASRSFGKQLSSIQRDPNQNYSANVDRLLSNSETGLKQFQAQQFSDPKIRGFQQSTLNIMVQFHNDMITTAEAVERNDHVAFTRDYKQMMSALQPLKQLSKQYESYCGRSK